MSKFVLELLCSAVLNKGRIGTAAIINFFVANAALIRRRRLFGGGAYSSKYGSLSRRIIFVVGIREECMVWVVSRQALLGSKMCCYMLCSGELGDKIQKLTLTGSLGRTCGLRLVY